MWDDSYEHHRYGRLPTIVSFDEICRIMSVTQNFQKLDFIHYYSEASISRLWISRWI